MQARLVAVAGPLTGALLPLGGSEITVGRDPGNTIALTDQSVAPRHCVIHQRNDRLVVQVLDGFGETFVNGLPASGRMLSDADEIRIGQSLFVVQIQAAALDRSAADVLFAYDGIDVLRQFQREEVLSPVGNAQPRSPSADLRAADLVALLRISTAISSIRGYVGLERPLLELLFDAIPARRGVVLFVEDDDSLRTATATGLDRVTGSIAPVPIVRSLIEPVLREGVAILARTTGAAPPRARGEQVRWLLAAPLLAFDRVLGAVYLESNDALSESHLLLLAATCGMAAVALDHARHLERVEEESRRFRAEIDLHHNMVGSSAVMGDLYRCIMRVARAESTALIMGESGTGKELAARAIHRNSTRAEKPFVAINCAAIPEALLESELFGHEKGAFTGAIAQKKGRLELAEGGTLLLDEIGELPLALQAKLLRVLQEREFERVGGTHRVKVDFRLIASTNRNLEAAIRTGTFRQDLYYRLNVVPIRIPPLRERREDIPLLAQYLAQRHAGTAARTAIVFSPDAMAVLMAHDWPGNVRELENAVERAIVLGSGGTVRPEDLPESILDAAQPIHAPPARYQDGIRERKRELILGAIEQGAGNLTAAAKLLGVHPNYLHRLIRTLQLRPALKK
jgi:transcriptional regulator with GAF, ATPase, and Fis domain